MVAKCLLCPPRLSAANHDSLWQALQERGHEGVVAEARTIGLTIDERQSRSHFQYHRPRQSKPRKRWRSQLALEQIAKLTKRQRALIDLCFRVPGLGAKELGRTLYWSGEPEGLVAAEKAALRDLRRLIRDDIVFRCYLENLSGSGARPDEISGLYFLGVNGRAYVEQLHNIELNREEWVAEDSDLGNWADVYARHRAHQCLSALQQLMPGERGRRFAQLSSSITIQWDERDWLDRSFLPRRFKDPLNEATRIRPAGLAALTITQRNAGQHFLVPFLYYHDAGGRRLELLLDDLTAHAALARSGAMNQALPDIVAHVPLPALIITSSVNRTRDVIAASQARIAPGVLALACDERTFASSGLQGACWLQLFKRNDVQPLTMPAALLQHYKKAPTQAQHLPLRWKR